MATDACGRLPEPGPGTKGYTQGYTQGYTLGIKGYRGVHTGDRRVSLAGVPASCLYYLCAVQNAFDGSKRFHEFTIMYCTVMCSTVLYCTVLYCTAVVSLPVVCPPALTHCVLVRRLPLMPFDRSKKFAQSSL